MIRSQFFKQPPFILPFDDATPFLGKRIGMTGAGGVVGSILIRRLSELGVSIKAFQGDIRDRRDVEGWIDQGYDIIFHLAAVVPVQFVRDNPLSAYETNALGPANVAAAAISANPSCWLFAASTSHVYESHPPFSVNPIAEDSKLLPRTFYGKTKLLGERMLAPLTEDLGSSICIGRVFSFSHATQPPPYLVPTLRNRILNLHDNDVLEVVNATATRDFLDAETVVDCISHLASRQHVGTVNIGSGEGKTIEEVARLMAIDIGRSVVIRSAGEKTADAVVADVTLLRSVLGATEGHA